MKEEVWYPAIQCKNGTDVLFTIGKKRILVSMSTHKYLNKFEKYHIALIAAKIAVEKGIKKIDCNIFVDFGMFVGSTNSDYRLTGHMYLVSKSGLIIKHHIPLNNIFNHFLNDPYYYNSSITPSHGFIN